MGNSQSAKKPAVTDAELAGLEKELQNALAMDDTQELELDMLDQELDMELHALDVDAGELVGLEDGGDEDLDPAELEALEGELAELEAEVGLSAQDEEEVVTTDEVTGDNDRSTVPEVVDEEDDDTPALPPLQG